MKSNPTVATTDNILSLLRDANTGFNGHFPGDRPDRQPIHTVYGGAQIFTADTAKKLGAVAMKTLAEYAPNAGAFAKALGLDFIPARQKMLYDRVVAKLTREPVEDFRIDFEDGYGNRPDAEEDGHAESTAGEIARGMNNGTLPPFIGIRIKPFTEELKSRSIRTLNLFMSCLLGRTGGILPENFVVTLPKVTIPDQVAALDGLLTAIERRHRLPERSMKLEIMVETPQSIIGPGGFCALPGFVAAAEGRCIAAHFGVYDYTASMNITAEYQSMEHEACDFARNMMKVSLAGTGVWISDGATNVMPVGPHRSGTLTPKQKKENLEVVHRIWRLNLRHITHSLVNGYYQGWDLHPAQLPVRYAAVYAFFLKSLDSASLRLRTFVDKAAQATLIGDVFDDAATGQGLLNYFLRGIGCGALSEEEAMTSGLTHAELRTRSFVKILAGRTKRPKSGTGTAHRRKGRKNA